MLWISCIPSFVSSYNFFYSISVDGLGLQCAWWWWKELEFRWQLYLMPHWIVVKFYSWFTFSFMSCLRVAPLKKKRAWDSKRTVELWWEHAGNVVVLCRVPYWISCQAKNGPWKNVAHFCSASQIFLTNETARNEPKMSPRVRSFYWSSDTLQPSDQDLKTTWGLWFKSVANGWEKCLIFWGEFLSFFGHFLSHFSVNFETFSDCF